jgi:hypothetical protein
MTRSSTRRWATVLAIGLAAVPICFGTVRAATTGTDFRYLVTAVASLAAGATVFWLAAARVPSRWLRSGVAFVVAVLAGAAAAWWQGARSVPATGVVAVGFALCTTASGWLGLFSRRAV